MRTVIVATTVVLLLAGCSALSPWLDSATGTTLEQRCMDRRAAIAALEAVAEVRALTLSETEALAAYGVYVASVCASVPPLSLER